MAKTNATRKKKSTGKQRQSVHIANVLNVAINKFYITGDMNHSPMSFHTSDINMYLKGIDLQIGLQEMTKFFYQKRQSWTFAVYHFFKVNGKIEVAPTIMRIDDTLLNEVADAAEENIKLLKESVLDTEDGFTEENYVFYGYYINYSDGLRMDLMEDKIIPALLKVNNDLTNINPEVVTCTAEKVLRAIASEKFSSVNSKALTTGFKEEATA